ncbi:MAG TPA: hypothetical protein VIM62_02375, partial [Acidobacteriaceae bacterium]
RQPLTFYNSVGLRGSWVLANRSLPVDLQLRHGTENPGNRLYAQVTDQPDAVYEAMVTRARDAILKGNLDETARSIHFPLTVNGAHSSLIIQDTADLRANWSKIFTPKFLAKLQEDIPHEMFVHEGEAMLGDGELWFDDKGLAVLNPVFEPRKPRKSK